MNLVEFVPPRVHPLWRLCLQMGIRDVVVKVNPTLTGVDEPWKLSSLSTIADGLKSAGLKVVGLEGDPFDVSPIKQFGEDGRSAACREEALAHYRELLESMSELGIYNFWLVSESRVRGGFFFLRDDGLTHMHLK